MAEPAKMTTVKTIVRMMPFLTREPSKYLLISVVNLRARAKEYRVRALMT
jgi:hypothetical protein